MEAAYGSTGDSDEKAWEDGVISGIIGRDHIAQRVPGLGESREFNEKHHHKPHRHKEESSAEEGIYFADDFIDRQ